MDEFFGELGDWLPHLEEELMERIRCTCKQRLAVPSRNRLYPHEANCPWAARLAEEDRERARQAEAKQLYSHYRRSK